MGLISRLYSFTQGDTILSSEVNAEFSQLVNVCNENTKAFRELSREVEKLKKRIKNKENKNVN